MMLPLLLLLKLLPVHHGSAYVLLLAYRREIIHRCLLTLNCKK